MTVGIETNITRAQDLFDCSELNEEFDLIIQLAGKSGVRESMKDPAGYWSNVEVSKRLFESSILEYKNFIRKSKCMNLIPIRMARQIVEEAPERYPDTLGMRFHTVYSDSPAKECPAKLIDNELEYTTRLQRLYGPWVIYVMLLNF